jgi:hypothetical protein
MKNVDFILLPAGWRAEDILIGFNERGMFEVQDLLLIYQRLYNFRKCNLEKQYIFSLCRA